MNLYDFDNTIIKGDSSIKLIKYSFFRHPIMLTISSFKALKELIKGSSLGNIKSELFSFVKKIPDLDIYINKFILKNKKHIKKFYLERQKDDDVVISASFDFIIIPFCHSIGINNVIATKYDTKNGCIIGKNCKGEEKVKRFKEVYENVEVNEAYSDSLSDLPMFKLAKKAYLVKNEEIILYEEK